MKKFSVVLLGAMILGSSAFAAGTATKVGVLDGLKLMKECKEWQNFEKSMQTEVDTIREELQVAQKELMDMQQKIQTQASILSPEALQEKNQQLAQKKKEMERKFADKDEALKGKVQRKQMAIRRNHLQVAKESVFDKDNLDLMVEKNAPSVIFIKDTIDVTDKVLKAVNDKYEKDVATKITGKDLKVA